MPRICAAIPTGGMNPKTMRSGCSLVNSVSRTSMICLARERSVMNSVPSWSARMIAATSSFANSMPAGRAWNPAALICSSKLCCDRGKTKPMLASRPVSAARFWMARAISMPRVVSPALKVGTTNRTRGRPSRGPSTVSS